VKLLITGGLGFLGSHLADYFVNAGYDVSILEHAINADLHVPGCRIIQADITDLKDLHANLLDRFDYCLHLASSNDSFIDSYPRHALVVNALGTRNIAEVMAERRVARFIYFSTFHVYGALAGRIDESMSPNPRNDYAITHLFGEYYTNMFSVNKALSAIVIRLTNGYGAPRRMDTTKWYLILNNLARMAYEKKTIVLESNGESSRDFVWVGDICTIMEKLPTSTTVAGGTYNISAGKTYKMIEIAEIVKRVYERRYGSPIEIMTNANDKTRYSVVEVSNDKLTRAISVEFHERFEEEVDKVFDLLEAHYHA